MLKAVTGTYSNGQITLDETPPDIDQAPVVITFLPVSQQTPSELTTPEAVPASHAGETERGRRLAQTLEEARRRYGPLLSPSDEFARQKAEEVARDEHRAGD
jgi:hypothetical protein